MTTESARLLEITESSTCRFKRAEIREDAAEAILHHYSDKLSIDWPSPKTEHMWELTATPWVGHIPVTDDLALYLAPKVPLANLFGMLEYAYNLQSFKFLEGDVEVDSLAAFYERLAKLFSLRVLDRERKGLYREYVPRHDALPFVRGRLDIADRVRRPWSVAPVCSYQEHTADVEDNQILSFTLLVIARSGICTERVLPLVRRAYRSIQCKAVPHPFSASDCINRLYTRLNDDYSTLHALCRFFLEHAGPTHDLGDRTMLPFLVNTARLYERFVAEWLKIHLPDGLSVNAQEKVAIGGDGRLHFDIDLVLTDDDTGQVRSVLDTKYKDTDYPSEADIQQIVAYAEAKSCNDAVLIYPTRHVISSDIVVGKIRVRRLTFALDGDLEKCGEEFLRELA